VAWKWRELRTTIERAIVLSGLSEIDVQHLPMAVVDPTVVTQKQAQVEENRTETKLKLDEQLDNFERRLMKRALELAGGSRKDAVKLLGISESRFFRRARALQLSES
jgi:DNA-binding NtrC family response regulator